MPDTTAPTVEVGTISRGPSGALVLSGQASHAPGPTQGAQMASDALAGLLAWAKANPVAAAVLAYGVYRMMEKRR